MNIEPLFQRRIHPGIARAAQYCLDLATGRDMPRRSDFRPSSVRSILGYIFLIEVQSEPDPYFFKLFGVHMSDLFGIDLTGKNLSQIGNVALETRLRNTYDAVVSGKTFQYVRGKYTWPDQSIAIERLLVPMTNDEGQLNTIFGLTIPDISTESLSLYAGIGAAHLEIDEEFRTTLALD